MRACVAFALVLACWSTAVPAAAQGVFGGGRLPFPNGVFPPPSPTGVGRVMPSPGGGRADRTQPPRVWPRLRQQPLPDDPARDRWRSYFGSTDLDVYRARRRTYLPNPLPPGLVVYGSGYPLYADDQQIGLDELAAAGRSQRWMLVPIDQAEATAAREPRAEPPPPPAPPPAPAPPRTFYVIPGCYAGDVAPRPEQLPRGCDPARLRVIPPRNVPAPAR
jgi:hypothetical protein